MEKLFLDNTVVQLTNSELVQVNGGDKFMHDLGYAIGWIAGEIEDAYDAIGEIGYGWIRGMTP